jgi:hypothetical protein
VRRLLYPAKLQKSNVGNLACESDFRSIYPTLLNLDNEKNMKQLIGMFAASAALLITGCSSNPVAVDHQAGNDVPVSAASPASTDQEQFKIGQSSVTVERLARQQGCVPVKGANLISSSGPTTEHYQVACSNGTVVAATCEYRQCSITPANGTTIQQPVPVAASQNTAMYTAPAVSPAPGSTEQRPYQLTGQRLNYVAGIGYARGGDTLLTATYTDGTHTSIKAGNGLHFLGGLQYRLGEHFSVLGDVGYQSSTGSAVNGELTFKRFPVEMLGYFHLNSSVRFGAGVRFDERVKLSGTGVASPVQQDFNSTEGAILEAEYLVTPNFGIKLQGVKENYTATGFSGKINGNQIGLYSTLYF